jgi:hypothetical protein
MASIIAISRLLGAVSSQGKFLFDILIYLRLFFFCVRVILFFLGRKTFAERYPIKDGLIHVLIIYKITIDKGH